MKIRFFEFFIIVALFFLSNLFLDDKKELLDTIEPCHSEKNKAREIMEKYLTDQEWLSERIATGTNHLTVTDIQLLSDGQDDVICEELNLENSEALNETRGSNNDHLYDLTYYRAGNFYFVITVLGESSDPDEIWVGLSYLEIYNSYLNRIEGYSF